MQNKTEQKLSNFIGNAWLITYNNNDMVKDCQDIYQTIHKLVSNNAGNMPVILSEARKLIGRYYLLNNELLNFIVQCHNVKAPFGSNNNKERNKKFVSEIELTVSKKNTAEDYISNSKRFIKSQDMSDFDKHCDTLSALMLSYSMMIKFLTNFNINIKAWQELFVLFTELEQSDFEMFIPCNFYVANQYFTHINNN